MSEKKKVTNSESEKELQKLQEQFDNFDKQVKEMTHDRMNMAPKEELEPQTKIANKDLDKCKDIYLKPIRKIADGQKFNENFRDKWEFAKEYVHFIAENKEIIGEDIEIWTHPFGGVGAEFWKVPVNKPVWGPRYLAEQISTKFYHRLVMRENVTIGSDGMGQYYGSMAVDTTIPRLEAKPVTRNRSIFMGGTAF